MRSRARSIRRVVAATCRFIALALLCDGTLLAADLEESRKLFLTGQYAEAASAAEKAISEDVYDEAWSELLARARLAVGRYPEAEAAVTRALSRYNNSIRLRLLGYEVFRANGKSDRARMLLEEINELGGSRMGAYRDPVNLVVLGKAALLLGADARLVLENFFDQAKRGNPNLREPYLASGELALEKSDFQVAARAFNEALRKFPEDPEVHFGLARAFAPSATAPTIKALEATLERNTNHVPAMLLVVDHQVDAEDYGEADKMLDRALTVNPWHPEAWAYRAVLAHLRNDPPGEAESRSKALRFWNANPLVDHLIGRKLSQKYRFTEGSTRQRQALKFDANYLPAKIQLVQDLLRLGEETEGWQLAKAVHERDGYDVTAYNLVTLHDTVAKFQTLSNEHFVVRMGPHKGSEGTASEASIYGDRVLALLERARKLLSEKYGLSPEPPTYIEIFPEQKDFAVRTFGMPHNPGFLGVCFGRVVTANSPASQTAHPANWEAVLWHEFCHVITLQLTRNKMPRWLSEGISVYEERQANPAWGEPLTPEFREMLLGDDLTPVGKLSSAFLSPKSDMHIQFAYYESSLVVEFLVNKFGIESLKRILRDLAEGTGINDAIARNTAPMDQIEKDFTAYARGVANQLAPGLDWKKPEPSELKEDLGSLGAFVRSNPSNYWALTVYARKLLDDEKWDEARTTSEKLVELFPGNAAPNSGYVMLAAAYRGLNETNRERQTLETLATLNAAATDVYLRLMELAEAAKDWPDVARQAERFLAVNPLLPQPHRYLARAAESIGEAGRAIDAYRRVLMLDPADPAEVHFRLANLLHRAGDAAAKQHVLQALEEAPRFREAHRLLLQLAQVKTSATNAVAPASPPAPEPAR